MCLVEEQKDTDKPSTRRALLFLSSTQGEKKMKEVVIVRRSKVFICPEAMADKAKSAQKEKPRQAQVRVPRGGSRGVIKTVSGVRIKW